MAGREASGAFTLSLTAIVQDTTADSRLSTPTAQESFSHDYRFTTGTASDQFDRVYSKVGTLSASGTLDLDLTGSLEDNIGQSFNLVEVCAIAIKNRTTTNGVTLQVGAAAANPLAGLFGATPDYINVMPGGALIWVAPNDGGGVTVTGGSADTLRLTNASGSVALDYSIMICGRSA